MINMKDLIKKQTNIIRKESGMNIKEETLNEIQIEAEDIQDMGAAIFDVVMEFKKNFEKSDWSKNRKINSIIKQMIKLESQLSNETQEF